MTYSLTSSQGLVRVSTRARSRWLTWALVVAAALLTGYTALWFYAAQRGGIALDAWIAAEGRQGRTWTFAERRFYGFPLKFAIGCRAASFAQVARSSSPGMTGSLGAVDVSISLFDPNRATATIEGPLKFSDETGSAIAASWDSLRIEAVGLFQLDRATLRLTHPLVQVSADGATMPVKAAEAALDLRMAGAVRPSDTDVQLLLEAVETPALNSLFGSEDPATLKIAATISNALFLHGADTARAVETWRLSGGRFDLAGAALDKGKARLGLKGRVRLDDARRLQGTLSVAFAGVDAMLDGLGVPVQAVKAGSVLFGLFGEAEPADAKAGRRSAVLPLAMADGRVSLGLIQLPIKLAPLY